MSYDANGNLTKDLDRDIVTIKYNLLNLPEIIQFKNGNQIRNTYDASGQKLKTRNYTVIDYTLQPIVAENTIRDVMLSEEVYVVGSDYIGNVEYHYDAEYYGGEFSWDQTYLSMLYNPEGYCQNTEYVILNYYRRDHLGNNREVWRAPFKVGSTNYAATTMQRTQYYPSGLPRASNSSDNPWIQNKKYNGKEFVEMHGLDEYDSEARWYIPGSVRTPTMDPHCENYYDTSPYAWCGNNFVNRFDSDGMDYESSTFITSTFVNGKGEFIEHRNDGDDRVYMVDDEEKWRKNGSKKEDAKYAGVEYTYVDYNDYSEGDNVNYLRGWDYNNDIFSPWRNNAPLEIDNTLESMFIPVFSWLKYLKFGKVASKTIVKSVGAATKGFSKGKVFIKGVGNLEKEIFHSTIKRNILKSAGNYTKVVGSNPDVVVKNGVVILKGNGPYSGKVFQTTLNASDFFH